MEPSAKRLCPDCGAENEGAAFYCSRCRAFLRGRKAAAAAPAPLPAPAPRPGGESRPMGSGFSPFDLGAPRPEEKAPPAPPPAEKEEDTYSEIWLPVRRKNEAL